MTRPPRCVDTPILSKELLIMMLSVGFYMLISSTVVYQYYIDQGKTQEYARTVCVNIFVFIEIFYLFTCKNLHKSTFKIDFFDNRYIIYGVALMVVLQILLTNVSFMNNAFSTTPISLNSWGIILSISFVVIFLVEILKYTLFYRHRKLTFLIIISQV